jgi:hypothetical protein
MTKRWIIKPAREAGKFIVIDTVARYRDAYIVSDPVSRAKAVAMVRELEKTFR